MAGMEGFPIHWGTKGFSLNVDLEGSHVAICFGYPPESVYRQSLYTALRGQGGMTSKTAVPEEVVNELWEKAKGSGLFTPAGHELRCRIDRKFSESQTSSLLDWIKEIAQTVRKYGLKE